MVWCCLGGLVGIILRKDASKQRMLLGTGLGKGTMYVELVSSPSPSFSSS